MINPHIQALIRLLAREAAETFLKYPDAVNYYFMLPESKRSVLIKEARRILEKKS
jgi:hypothetical protein